MHGVATLFLLGVSPGFSQTAPEDVPAEDMDTKDGAPDPTVEEAPEVEEGPVERVPNAYVSGQDAHISDPRRDVFALAQNVTIDATVTDNVFAMGQDIRINEPVGGDLLAMGEDIIIDSEIGGDVYAMGATIEVTEDGVVRGDVHTFSGELMVPGQVLGDLYVGAGTAEIAGRVHGNAVLQVGELTFAENASVGGDLTYEAPAATEGIEAVVSGTVTFTEQVDGELDEVAVPLDFDDNRASEPAGFMSYVFGALWWLFGTVVCYGTMLLVGFATLAIGGPRAGTVGRTILARPGESLGFGFVLALVIPIASIVAMFFVLPIPLSLAALAVWGMLIVFAEVFTAQTLGDLILRRFRPGALGSPYLSMAVGLIPLVLLTSVPSLGPLFWLVATFAGIGGLFLVIRAARAERSGPSDAAVVTA